MTNENPEKFKKGGMWGIPGGKNFPPHFPENEFNCFIADIAEETVRRNMTVPFIMFLDLVLPLASFGSACLTMASPFLEVIFPREKIGRWEYILEHRDRIQMLSNAIEERQRKNGC